VLPYFDTRVTKEEKRSRQQPRKPRAFRFFTHFGFGSEEGPVIINNAEGRPKKENPEASCFFLLLSGGSWRGVPRRLNNGVLSSMQKQTQKQLKSGFKIIS
jgi:hypothetical protein